MSYSGYFRMHLKQNRNRKLTFDDINAVHHQKSERKQHRRSGFGIPPRPPWPSYGLIVKNGQCVKPWCFLCASTARTDRCVAVVNEVLKGETVHVPLSPTLHLWCIRSSFAFLLHLRILLSCSISATFSPFAFIVCAPSHQQVEVCADVAHLHSLKFTTVLYVRTWSLFLHLDQRWLLVMQQLLLLGFTPD